jgi:succinoglycan biosynthesis protein ExoM
MTMADARPSAIAEEYCSRLNVDVCICSYRRPQIVDTLAALSRQTGIERLDLRLVVADNSPAGEIRQIVRGAAEKFGLELHYVHAPANNISIARNACLDAARGEWIAFLDDDEIPEANWLSELIKLAETGEWDAVLGPVLAVYGREVPSWLSSGDFHSTRPVWVEGQIQTAYTGNVLVRRSLCEEWRLRFRLELGKTGGEDEDFFYRFRDKGGRIGYSAAAIAREAVPPQRASVRWLLRRNFRAGQSHGARLRMRGRVLKAIVLASAKAAYCGGAAALPMRNLTSRIRFLTRAALHCGVVAHLAGVATIKSY